MKFRYDLVRCEEDDPGEDGFGYEVRVDKFFICKEAIAKLGVENPEQIKIRTKKKEGYTKIKLRAKIRGGLIEVDWKCPSIGVDEWDETDISLANWAIRNILIDKWGYTLAKAKIWIKLTEDTPSRLDKQAVVEHDDVWCGNTLHVAGGP